MKVNKKLDVTIPAGINSYQNIVLRGQGSAGRNGGPNGDLIIEVKVKNHSFFTREGNNLYCEMPISFAQAALGTEIKIPMLDGSFEKLSIPEGTQSGKSFTLRGKGIVNLNNPKRQGDIIVTVNVETPQNLTSEQKKLLKAFDDSFGKKKSDETAEKEGFFKKFFDK